MLRRQQSSRRTLKRAEKCHVFEDGVGCLVVHRSESSSAGSSNKSIPQFSANLQ